MKRGGQSLFSYFKPTSSPAASNGRQSPKLVTPQRPVTPKGGKSGGHKKRKSSTPSARNQTPKVVNGEQIENGRPLNLEPVLQLSPEAEQMEEGGRTEATPSSRKRPRPLLSDDSEAVETERGRVKEMEATPTLSSRKRPHPLQSDDSEEEIGVRKTLSGRPKRLAAMTSRERQREKKRPKRALDSDDSEDEYRPGSSESMGSDSCSSGEEEKESVGEEEEEVEMEEEEESFVTPSRKPKKSPAAATPKTPASRKSAISRVTSGTASPLPTHSSTPHIGTFTHDTLNWLKEDQRKDKFGRRINDPDYNHRTLKVPPEFLKVQTPAMKQWWQLKIDNFDTILMFKVGKFYELYHMDAVVGVNELGLVFMKGDFAHSGFPEIAFGRYAQTLVQKGYKVARVEQTETPQMMEKRVKKMVAPTKHDKVVRREICSIITKGTRTLSFSEGVESDREAAFLIALKEKSGTGSGGSVFGVCFVDTCIGQFHLGQLADDRQCSRLRTLIAHHPPAQFLFERHNLSVRTQQVLKQLLGSSMQDALAPKIEFWDSGKTLKALAEGGYFSAQQEGSEELEWPEVLRGMLAEDDSLGLTASDDHDLAVSALGACVWCLQRCHADQELLSLKSFARYKPLDMRKEEEQEERGREEEDKLAAMFVGKRMVLDDITLTNLDVLDNHGRLAGTLLERLDHCSTPFGKRLLKQWLCAPLCNPAAIADRLDAVTMLIGHAHLVGEAREVLRSLPDLQRLLRQIHSVGQRRPDSTHPDSRAILYEEAAYSKRKIIGFLSALDGFQSAMKLPKIFSPLADSCPAGLLRRLVTFQEKGGQFPDMSEQLKFFSHSFDRKLAKKEGTIVPAEGVNPSYDRALDTIRSTTAALDDYLKRQKKRLGCQSIVYWGTGRNRYQLEVPESALARYTPDEYDLKSQKKGFRRYWTREIEQHLEKLIAAEDEKQFALKDTMRTIFHSFAEHFHLWESAVQCLATLDVLMNLATYSSLGDGEMCRPDIVLSPVPFLNIQAGRHPCVVQTYTGDDFIPNDVIINGDRSQDGRLCVIVTGPNMGGKSTLMRQTGLIVILAQLGCYVPASSCQFSPVDRVFTRIGASDRIMAGESTFFVELSETSTILQHATPHSLVLLDELGRGTATYDGTAIACAVVRELAEEVRCRCLFSTHYHSLVDEFHGNQRIQLGHMACMVENEDQDGGEGEGEGGSGDKCEEETITFLYKFIEGACPKSYGFNAARLAGLPSQVIRAARQKAREFERSTEKQRLLRKLLKMGPGFSLDDLAHIQSLLKQLL